MKLKVDWIQESRSHHVVIYKGYKINMFYFDSQHNIYISINDGDYLKLLPEINIVEAKKKVLAYVRYYIQEKKRMNDYIKSELDKEFNHG